MDKIETKANSEIFQLDTQYDENVIVKDRHRAYVLGKNDGGCTLDFEVARNGDTRYFCNNNGCNGTCKVAWSLHPDGVTKIIIGCTCR